jgi:hypothetical protein
MTGNASSAIQTFKERYAVECLPRGGVAVDLVHGGYFQLNETAALACAIMSEATDELGAETALAERMGVAEVDARSIIAHVLRNLSDPTPREEPVGPFRYKLEINGYGLWDREHLVLQIDVENRVMRLRTPSPSYAILDCVRAVAPKLLCLSGVTVMHASACVVGHSVLGFSGRSGAGKTTTVRAFTTAGASLVSEDLLILAGHDPSPSFYAQGERKVHAWTNEVADRLAADPEVPVSYTDLISAANGPRQRLDELWFLSSERRAAGSRTFQRRPLDAIEGTLSLLRNTFLGEADGGSWRRHLRASRYLAEQVSLFETTPPEGLVALTGAAADVYTTKSAS